VPSPGNPQSLNRYAYVVNNPLRYHDPSGHCPICIAIGAFLRGGATLGGRTATFPEDTYTPSLPTYRQGAVEVRQNRATIEALATDHAPAILLAAAIANQNHSWQRPMGLDWRERIQIAIGEHHQFKGPRHSHEGWSLPKGVDTNHIWQLLQIAFG